MEKFTLSPETHTGLVTIAVSSLDRSLEYYQQSLGFQVLEQGAQAALLGAGDTALLALVEQEQAQPQPPHTTGLYHFAILVPSREDLAYVVLHLAQTRTPVDGMADHLVSEAFYLSDPDGNGIEIYRDRPRSEWPMKENEIQMANAPIDVDALLAEAQSQNRPWSGLPAGTRLGHMHLRVADIQKAEEFYHDLLGFDIMQRWRGALFVSAGGYHHHIGLNTWESQGAPPPPSNAVGLRFYTLQLPNDAEIERLYERLQTTNYLVERSDDHTLVLRDPFGNGLLVTSVPITILATIQAGLR